MAAELTTFVSQRTRQGVLPRLFGSGSRVAVLGVFMLDPMRAYYQRQIEAATGIPIRAVQRELERLTGVGLLLRRVEGNRTYYQVDTQFPLFPELRNMVLKSVGDVDRLRGVLAAEESVRLAFLLESARSVLIVAEDERLAGIAAPERFRVRVVGGATFIHALAERPEEVAPFLQDGVDLLGRREDVIWRRIEAAGYAVQKGRGVA